MHSGISTASTFVEDPFVSMPVVEERVVVVAEKDTVLGVAIIIVVVTTVVVVTTIAVQAKVASVAITVSLGMVAQPSSMHTAVVDTLDIPNLLRKLVLPADTRILHPTTDVIRSNRVGISPEERVVTSPEDINQEDTKLVGTDPEVRIRVARRVTAAMTIAGTGTNLCPPEDMVLHPNQMTTGSVIKEDTVETGPDLENALLPSHRALVSADIERDNLERRSSPLRTAPDGIEPQIRTRSLNKKRNGQQFARLKQPGRILQLSAPTSSNKLNGSSSTVIIKISVSCANILGTIEYETKDGYIRERIMCGI
jgi:hypothetical protein